MSALDIAITQLETDVANLAPPPVRSAGDLSPEWFRLRALSTGLSLLRAIRAQGLGEDPVSAESFRKATRSALVELAPGETVVDAQIGTEVPQGVMAATP